MARYALTAFVSPLPGQEEAFMAWHRDQHVPEVLQVPGFLRCSRFEAAGAFAGDGRWPLMAIYEIETDDLDNCLSELKARLADGRVSSTTLGDASKRTLLTWKLISEHTP